MSSPKCADAMEFGREPVQAWRPPEGLVLDGREHGGRLRCAGEARGRPTVGSTVSEGSSPSVRQTRHKLVFGRSCWNLNHDAVIRIGGEAPGRRAHSKPRLNDHVQSRVATTWPGGRRARRPAAGAIDTWVRRRMSKSRTVARMDSSADGLTAGRKLQNTCLVREFSARRGRKQYPRKSKLTFG